MTKLDRAEESTDSGAERCALVDIFGISGLIPSGLQGEDSNDDRSSVECTADTGFPEHP